MGKKSRKIRSKSKSDDDDDDENPNNSCIILSDTDDDVAANEDLSLKIVQKAISRAASRDAAVDGGDGDDGVVVTPVMKKVKKVKRKKVKKVDTSVPELTPTKEEVTVNITNDVNQVIIPETTETSGVDNSNVDNSVLRKLLRGPRYFDPPEKSWGACFNCGEEGHNAVSCKLAKRKRPCFICGSLEHEVKQCQKAQDCYICKDTGHRAKDCPKKLKRYSQGSELCLKCGIVGHAMFSCNNDYSPSDMKEIQCYICKKFGHLCCADYSDAFSSEVSCYKCGESGHNGQECRGSRGAGETSTGSPSLCFKCGNEGHFARECTESVKECRGTRGAGETSTGSPSLCFKCGNEGHFARECTVSVKAKKRTREFSTPSGKRPKDIKEKKRTKSAPQDIGNGHKKNKLFYNDQSPNWSGKSKRRGGWIADDPEYPPHRNAWRSPTTPKMNHNIYSLTHTGRDSSPHSSNRSNFNHATPSSSGYGNSYQHSHNRYSSSRFGYGNNSNGMKRNYDWW